MEVLSGTIRWYGENAAENESHSKQGKTENLFS
jgi:hypothetical protein